jgi:hypothetical protein
MGLFLLIKDYSQVSPAKEQEQLNEELLHSHADGTL